MITNLYESYDLNNNRKLFDTKHSLDRLNDDIRFTDIQRQLIKDNIIPIVNEAIDIIINDYDDEKNHYGIHSKSTGIGLVIDWRRDTYNVKDVFNHAFIITLLSVKKYHHFRDEDVKIIVEELLSLWFKDKLRLEGKKQFKGKNTVYWEVEDDFSVVFYENKYWDSNIYKFLIVK